MNRREVIETSILMRCPYCGGSLPHSERLRVDLGTNVIYGVGVAVKVPPRQAELCSVLADTYPNLVRRQTLITKIWGDQEISDKLLDVVVCLTRRYLERIGYGIKNEFAIGYRLERRR
jgi:DNA-binding winged helix-turn-helix (wHTH) protein